VSYLAAPPSLPDRRHFFLVAGTPPSPVANAGAVVGTTNVVERDFKGIPYPGAPNGRFAFEGTGCKPAAPTFRLVFALSDATAPPDLAACNYRGSMRTESGADYLGRNTPTGAVLEQTNFRLSAQGQCDGVATPLAGRLKVAIHCTEGQPVVAWKSLARVRHRVDSLWQFDAGKTGNRTWDRRTPSGTVTTTAISNTPIS
jgi:hypothetical protein